jgi:hypothetical protein
VDRLEKSAIDVAGKQIAALEEAGAKLDATIDFEDLVNNPQGLKVIEATLEMRIPEGNGSNSKPRKDSLRSKPSPAICGEKKCDSRWSLERPARE